MVENRSEVAKQYYTWAEFDKDIGKIIRWAGGRNFKSVYGIPRGGLVVEVAISHRLGLPLKLKMEELDRDTLIVDDIADSGRTLENLDKSPHLSMGYSTRGKGRSCGNPVARSWGFQKRCGDKVLNFKPTAATLFFNNKDSRRRPDFYIREKKDWVVFPWETEISSRYDNS